MTGASGNRLNASANPVNYRQDLLERYLNSSTHDWSVYRQMISEYYDDISSARRSASASK